MKLTELAVLADEASHTFTRDMLLTVSVSGCHFETWWLTLPAHELKQRHGYVADHINMFQPGS